jgi:probable rRNA maturation factor
VAAALAQEGVRSNQDLNIVWVSRERLRALNRRFRGVRRYTDVIAFRYPAHDRGFPLPHASMNPFGDLYIALAQARLNAGKFRVPLAEEMARLAVHGTLHLLGYTDYQPRERKKMWSVQEAIVRRLVPSARRAARPGEAGHGLRSAS